MTTYINKYWDSNNRKRFYEATTVCFAVGEENPNPKNWEEAAESVPENMDKLFIENSVEYYGFL